MIEFDLEKMDNNNKCLVLAIKWQYLAPDTRYQIVKLLFLFVKINTSLTI